VIPAHGVYACFATIAGARHDAAVNVGTRPTFAGRDLLIEAHIIDFEGDLYGADLTLEFVEYLRPELTFDGVEPLVAQMADDVATCREVLAGARSRI
jgi:riboflavin kinase/FMN adenylyltransferase